MLLSLAGAGTLANLGGVFWGELNELGVTGTTTPVTVETGRALAYGAWYENDAALTVAIPTPAVSTRIDRIVLRKSWAAQTVRVTRIAGVEGGGAPSLTQVAGTTWDTPLAQASITTGGVITVTDERQYLPNAGEVRILKDADEIVNNSDVLQDDADFAFAVGANEKWVVEQVLYVTNASLAADFRSTFTLPAGATMLHMVQAMPEANSGDVTTNFGTTPGTAVVLALAVPTNCIKIQTVIRTGATAGTAQFQWAQGAAAAVDTTVKADSYLIAKRVP